MALDYEKLSKEFTKKLQEFDKEKIDAWMEKDAINLPFKSHGKPCSCYLCSPQKYNRAKMKKDIDTGAKVQLIHDDNWM